jgi:hypothetical protein
VIGSQSAPLCACTVASKEGASWTMSDYRKWLTEAGFTGVVVVETAGASSLVLAST